MAQVSAKRVQRDAIRRSDNRAFFNAGSRVQRKCDGCAETSFFGGSPVVQRSPFDTGGFDAETEMEMDLEPDTPEMAEPDMASEDGGSEAETDDAGGDEGGLAIQPQLEVGAVNDPMETEADRVADQVVRRQAAESLDSSDSANEVRAKAAEDATGPATPELTQGINRARGGGAAMAPDVRTRMEDSLGVDLSPVRVHTGAASAEMNDSIGARAFTYGTDIHFNSGQYDPSSPDGTRLLAHELTHVIQQTAGLRRKVRRATKKLPEMPRKAVGFGPVRGYPSGTTIHQELLPHFSSPTGATTATTRSLFIEATVPGANKDVVAPGLTGKPDFYTATTKIGLYEKAGADPLFGQINGNHATNAPRPPQKRLANGKARPVRNIENAPKRIGLGDLKPGFSVEEYLGHGQLKNYEQGIKNTATTVNNYTKKYHEEVEPLADGEKVPEWKPDPRASHETDIPTVLAEADPDGGVRKGKLAIYDFSDQSPRPLYKTELKGSLVVYKSEILGIYNYEWIPKSAPTTIDDTGVSDLVDALDRDVIKIVRTKRKVARSPKRARPVGRTAAQRVHPIQRQSNRPVIRRNKKHKKFDHKKFDRQFPKWQTNARDTIGDSAKTEYTIAAIQNVNRRRPKDIPGSSIVTEPSKKFKKARHWYNHGKKYRWFRKTFDKVYLRMQGFVTKVKKTFAKLRKSTGSSFGSWAKAAAKALMKVVKLYAAWALDQIASKLMGSLQAGINNITNHLLSDALPDDAKSVVETIQEKKADVEKFSASIETTFEESVFGDAMRFVKNFSAFEEIADTVSTLISIVEWGIRLSACAAPPLVGCLWNLAFSALQYAFSKIMETCWFTKEVYGWFDSMRNNSLVKPFYDFPTKQAKNVVKNANDLIPLPKGFPKVFGPITGLEKFEMDCSSGGGGSGSASMSPEQKAVFDLMKKLEGQEKGKFKALMAMLAANAAQGATALDAERISQIAAFVDGVSAADLQAIADGKKTDIPVDIETFLQSLKTKTKVEKKIDEKRDIDYEKAKEWNPKYQKKLGWDPEKFVRKGVKPDSDEFADAVYDIQSQLGLKTDGMIGKWTIYKFYTKNGIKPDSAYSTAVDEIKRHQAAIRYKKEYDAAKAKPWPKTEQLLKDLGGVQFPVTPGHFVYNLGKVHVAAVATDKLAKVGFYYRTETLNDADGKPTTVMFFSPAVTVDAVTQEDGFWIQGEGTYQGQKVQSFIKHLFEKALPPGTPFLLDM